jgi:hypothetical protein
LGVALAPFSGGNIDTLFTVGGQHTMVPRQIYAWLRH